jgi:hypothetical protein
VTPPSWRLHAPLALAVTVGLAPFLPSLGYGFTLDDENTILGHPGVQERLSFENLVLRDWWGRSRFDSIGTWRPLATLTFWIDRHVGGGAPWLFHATNLGFYALLLVVFDRLLRRWGGPPFGVWPRVLAVALFGVLAMHTEVVAGATGRAEILAALLSTCAIDVVTRETALDARRVVLASACLLGALLSKESAAPMAVLLPFLAHRARSRTPEDSTPRGALLALAVSCPLVLGAVAAFRALRMPFMQLTPERALENPLLAVDTAHRIAGALDVLAFYLGHLVTGAGLAPDYSFAEPPLLRNPLPAIVLGGGAVIALGGAVIVTWRRSPRVADALVAFGASYATASNVFLASSAIADRLFFFPSMWLVAAGVLLASRVLRRASSRRTAFALGAAFLAIQLARASAYASDWRNDLSLLGAAARLYPDVYRTQRNLAHAFADAHDDDAAAWHLAVAESIYARYPWPVERDAVRPEWDAEPLAGRLDHLTRLFGQEAACGAVRRAAARIVAWGEPAGADPLRAWAGRACPEPSER